MPAAPEPIPWATLLTVLAPLLAAGVGAAVWALKRAKRRAIQRELWEAAERAQDAERTPSTVDDGVAQAEIDQLKRELEELDGKE